MKNGKHLLHSVKDGKAMLSATPTTRGKWRYANIPAWPTHRNNNRTNTKRAQ